MAVLQLCSARFLTQNSSPEITRNFWAAVVISWQKVGISLVSDVDYEVLRTPTGIDGWYLICILPIDTRSRVRSQYTLGHPVFAESGGCTI